MPLNPEEVSSIIRKEIEKYETKLEMESVGTVLQVGDGIARIWGLQDVQMSELIQFPGDVYGLVLNLEADNVGAAIFGVRYQDQRRRHGPPDRPRGVGAGRRCVDRPRGQSARSAARRQRARS